ncbi:hypothetical protein EJD97_004023 [Solanum chilense]|uniref:DUF4378 domain-containing protein n=1 Tax=Solanum chilense TaxID=4083 RepID=A0A6N2CJ28_SOLCI|nr:hypothetical protein EJD97_004023 [Solanum chilense]
MPPDSLRSAVYRSFITCDDPKGVVECSTIRKSQMEKNTPCSSHKDEGRQTVIHTSSFHLMEVSREAQKLNQVIESWSKGMTIERHSNDIAKDLLKGALDLQESLVMLGKLQHIAKLKKKYKHELDGIPIQRTKSERISEHRLNRFEFQKPRFSVDGDCFDELREVIRDNFARQPNSALQFQTNSEKASVGTRIKSSHVPSTSSSHSSIVQSQQVSPPLDGPNLIARLMGLEEIPSMSQHQTTHKVVKQTRPIFEIDLPKAKKPTFISHKVDPKRKTFDEIIETMYFKGLLRSKSTHKFVDSPPIVIMKPLYEQNPSESRNKCEEISPDDHKGASIYRKMQAGKDHNNRFSKERGEAPSKSKTLQVLIQPNTKIIASSPGKHRGEANAKSKTLDFVSQEKQHNKNIRASSPGKDLGEAPANSKTLKLLLQEKYPNAMIKASSHRKYLGDATVKVFIQEKQPNTRTRASSPGKTPQTKKEPIGKREDGTQRVAPAIRNSKEMKNAKIDDSAKFQDQSKMSTLKVRKPERKPLAAQAKSTIYDRKRITTTASHNSISRKKNVKANKPIKSTPIATVADIKHKDESKEMVQAEDKDTDRAITKVTSTEELQLEKRANIFEDLVTDNAVNGENVPCESSVLSTYCLGDIKLVEQINCNINLDFTENVNFNSGATTRYLLLSSESFLCQSKELFETDVWEPTVWQTTSIDHEIADSTLLLDCANELLENKRSQCALAVNPLSMKAIKMRKFYVSFEKLVNEICDGIEVLRSYNKVAGKNLSADALYPLLERDLWCKGVAGSAWDLAWRTGLTKNEVEQVVTDIEKYLLAAFIDDLLTDFML